MSTYDSISNALTTGTIIAIVVGVIGGLVSLIGLIIVIVCIGKHMNRSSRVRTQGMILQPAQPYAYSQSWTNQYPPNLRSVANYPAATAPPYIASAPNYY